jgi:hypothetical protein
MGKHWVYSDSAVMATCQCSQNRSGGNILVKQYKYYMLPSTSENSTDHGEV